MIIHQDDPRVPRRPPSSEPLEEAEQPVHSSPYLGAIHKGMREGLLAAAAWGLANPLA